MPTVQEPVQTWVPMQALTVQLALVPAQQPKPSSHVPLQSSSTPLQTSAGGMQVPSAHVLSQVCIPVLPQLVVHDWLEPWTHAKVSSAVPLQSSSIPLQISAGGMQAPNAQVLSQSCIPVVPQLVVHDSLEPWTQAKVSSAVPFPSSSQPLQTSGAVQGPTVQVSVQSWVPSVPQLVVQAKPLEPSAHSMLGPSSAVPLQSSSTPLQVSVAPGCTFGSESSQSVPPGQIIEIAPSPSMSSGQGPASTDASTPPSLAPPSPALASPALASGIGIMASEGMAASSEVAASSGGAASSGADASIVCWCPASWPGPPPASSAPPPEAQPASASREETTSNEERCFREYTTRPRR